MRNIVTILRREVLSFFVSPLAYLIVTGFLLLSGYFFVVLLSYFNESLMRAQMMPFMYGEKPNLNEWVVQNLYETLTLILVFMVPLLTMRLMAEERRKGTFELLLTSPISVFEIVMGKYLGLAGILVFMLSLVFIFPLLLMVFGDPAPEFLPMLSGFLGMVLSGLAFASIGLAVSTIASNQMVAGISSMVVLLLLYVIHSPAQSVGGSVGSLLEYLSPVLQVRDMMRGVISLKALCYFLSLITLGLFVSQRFVEAERWR